MKIECVQRGMDSKNSVILQYEESQIPLSHNVNLDVNKVEDGYCGLLHEEYDIKSEDEDLLNWPNLDSESDENIISGITTPIRGKAANAFLTPLSFKDAFNISKDVTDEIKTEGATLKKHKKKRDRLNSTSSSLSSDFGTKQPKLEDYFVRSPIKERSPKIEKRQSEKILSDKFSNSFDLKRKMKYEDRFCESELKKKLKQKLSDENETFSDVSSKNYEINRDTKLSDSESAYKTEKKRKKEKCTLNDIFSEPEDSHKNKSDAINRDTKLSDSESAYKTKKKRKKEKRTLNDIFSEPEDSHKNKSDAINVQVENTMCDFQNSTKKKRKKGRVEESEAIDGTLSDEGLPVLYKKKKKKCEEKAQDNNSCEKLPNKKEDIFTSKKLNTREAHLESDSAPKLKKKKKINVDLYTESEVSQNSENGKDILSICESRTSPEPKKKKKKYKEANSADNLLIKNESIVKDSSFTHEHFSDTESLPSKSRKSKSAKQSDPSKFLNMEKFDDLKKDAKSDNSLNVDEPMLCDQTQSKKKKKKKVNGNNLTDSFISGKYEKKSSSPVAGCSNEDTSKCVFADSDSSKCIERKKKHIKDKTERVELLKEQNKFDKTALSTDYSFSDISNSTLNEKSETKYQLKENLSRQTCSNKNSGKKDKKEKVENSTKDNSHRDNSKIKDKFATHPEDETSKLQETLKKLRHEDDLKSQDISNLNVIVPWSVAPIHQIETRISAQPLKQQKMQLQNLGIEVKMGCFSRQEDVQLMKNWCDFVKLHNIPDDPEPFLSFTNSSNKRTLLLKERLKFARFLAHGLEDRLLYSVYNRFKRIYMKRTIGRFRDEEDQIICKYMKYSKSKTHYSDLAKLLKRDKWSVVKRWEQLEKEAKEAPKRVIWKRRHKIEKFMKNFAEVTNIDDVQQLKNRKITEEEWGKMESLMDISKKKLKSAWNLIIYPRLFVKSKQYCGDVKKELVKLMIKRGETDWKTVKWAEIAQNFDGFTGPVLCRIMKSDVRYKVPSNIRDNLKECLLYLSNIITSGDYPRGRKLKKIKVRDGRE